MKKKKAPKESLDDIFSTLNDAATVELFANDKFAGIEIHWSAKGVGFGQLILSYDKERGKWHADTERMSAAMVEQILQLAAPELAKLMIAADEYSVENKP